MVMVSTSMHEWWHSLMGIMVYHWKRGHIDIGAVVLARSEHVQFQFWYFIEKIEKTVLESFWWKFPRFGKSRGDRVHFTFTRRPHQSADPLPAADQSNGSSFIAAKMCRTSESHTPTTILFLCEKTNLFIYQRKPSGYVNLEKSTS